MNNAAANSASKNSQVKVNQNNIRSVRSATNANRTKINAVSENVKNMKEAMKVVLQEKASAKSKAASSAPAKESKKNNAKPKAAASAPGKLQNSLVLWRQATKQALEEMKAKSDFKSMLEKAGLDPEKLLLMKDPKKHPNIPKDHPSVQLYVRIKELHEQKKKAAGLA